MLATLVLASGLWVAAHDAGSRLESKSEMAVASPVPIEKVADDFARDLYWLVGSHSADLFSTAWAIHRCPQCVEVNPLAPTVEARIALKTGGVAAVGLTLWKLRRSGHGRAATVIRWASVAVDAVLVANNTRHAILKR